MSSSRVPLRGGSAGEPARMTALPHFHDGVKATELIQKNTYGLRILPAFQYDYSTMTPTSLLSVMPYRDPEKVDPETQKPVFTDWYFPLKVHKMIGNGQRTFVSPLLVEGHDAKDIDPLHNIFLAAKNSENPDWRNLTEKAKDEYNAILRRYRVFYVVNALMQFDNKLENRLVVMTGESLMNLKFKLNQRGGRGDTVLDPNWQDYCFGDVTSPQYGLWATVKPGVFNQAGMKTSLFHFSNMQQDDRPIGVQPYPIDPNTDWGQAFLAGRYNISDTEKVTRISLPEQILQYIVDDGYLPYDLVIYACAHHWTVPPQPTQRRHFAAPPGGGAEVPVGSAPVPALVPATVVPVRRFWMVIGGQAKGPFSESLVQQTLTAQRQDIQVCLEGQYKWCWASEFGMHVLPPSQPQPPAPAAPVGPGVLFTPTPFPLPASTPPVTLAPSAPGYAAVAPLPGTPPPAAAGAPSAPAAPGPVPAGMPPLNPAGIPAAGTAHIPPRPPAATPSPAAPPPPVASRPQPVQSAVSALPLAGAAFSAAPAAAAAPVALTAAEQAEYQQLFAAWTQNGGTGAELLSAAQIARFSYLSDRVAVMQQN